MIRHQLDHARACYFKETSCFTSLVQRLRENYSAAACCPPVNRQPLAPEFNSTVRVFATAAAFERGPAFSIKRAQRRSCRPRGCRTQERGLRCDRRLQHLVNEFDGFRAGRGGCCCSRRGHARVPVLHVRSRTGTAAGDAGAARGGVVRGSAG